MHLLKYSDHGEFTLATFDGDYIPEYAILSHRWGAEECNLQRPDGYDGQEQSWLWQDRYISVENRLGVTASNTFG